MPKNFLQKSLNILLRRQTNILSAAFIIMGTVFLQQLLGLIRQRLLITIYSPSNTLGTYLASTKFPDLFFQIVIVGALSSAFIPVFSDFLVKDKKEEAHKMASTLLLLLTLVFILLSVILFIFAPYFNQVMNLGSGFSANDMALMANLTRIIIFAQILFIIGSFFSVLLQSYNHFFIPGIAAAFYNLGIIVGIIATSSFAGIYAPAIGSILGAFIFIIIQLPTIKKIGFAFKPSLSIRIPGVLEVFHLMWPRTISIAVFQVGTLLTVTLVSFLANPGRNYVLFDYAQTVAFAPILLFGQSIAQAAFPVLSREKDKPEEFKMTFMTSFNQMLYLVLPVSVLFLVLRIPVVRLLYGASTFDWQATVLTGKTLAFFSISLFAQALVYLVSRGFYALHDTKTPLIVGAITTSSMLGIGYLFVSYFKFGIESIAFAYSISSMLNLFILMAFLEKKIGGFDKRSLSLSWAKIFIASFFTGFALYIPIKLLDQLVFDTTKTINLLILTGISSFAGLSLYLFLTWFLNVKEAMNFIHIFRKIGNWREILDKTEEAIDPTRMKA